MKYLESFTFPSLDEEIGYLEGGEDLRVKYYRGSFYPFKVLSYLDITSVIIGNITIFYGGNGCGKTTALNVIAEKLGIRRESLFNSAKFFPEYLTLCRFSVPDTRETADQRARRFSGIQDTNLPYASRIITSDDVFDHCMSQRRFNTDIDRQRADAEERYNAVMNRGNINPIEEYEAYKERAEAMKSRSAFVRKRICKEADEHSNGESAMLYFSERITDPGLYLLDEPENSLSFENQRTLADMIEEFAATGRYQFIIASHSPVFLAMQDALIYDFDHIPVKTRKWTELSGVREMYGFFKDYEHLFEDI